MKGQICISILFKSLFPVIFNEQTNILMKNFKKLSFKNNIFIEKKTKENIFSII